MWQYSIDIGGNSCHYYTQKVRKDKLLRENALPTQYGGGPMKCRECTVQDPGEHYCPLTRRYLNETDLAFPACTDDFLRATVGNLRSLAVHLELEVLRRGRGDDE